MRARRGLPDPARPDKKIGVREPILLDRVLERARDVLLADQIVERLRPIFARENLVAHALNLVRRTVTRKQKFGKRDRIYGINWIFWIWAVGATFF